MTAVMRRLLAAATVTAAAVMLAMPAGATAVSLTGQYQRAPVGGGWYELSNDAWGYAAYTAGAQAITGNGGTGFTITASAADAGSVQGYPHLLRGCDWDLPTCTPAAGFPAELRDLGGLHTSWAFTTISSGEWDASYDMFAGNAPLIPQMTRRAEVMVWLNWRLPWRPPCEAWPWIDGAYWCRWHYATPQGWYVAFARAPRVTSVAGLSLRPFWQYAVAHGWAAPRWQLAGVEAGFELWRGGAGLASSSFAASPW